MPYQRLQLETQTWLSTVQSLGGSVSPIQIRAANRFVIRGKEDGWIQPGQTFIWVALGDFNAMPACLVSAASTKSCTVNGFVAADYDINGLIGDGATKYLESNYNPTLFSPALSNLALGVCSHTAGESASCELGAQSGGSARMQLILNQTSVGIRVRAFSDTAGVGRLDVLSPTGSGKSLSYGIRDPLGLTAGINGVQFGSAIAGAGALPNVTASIFCHNSSGTRSLFSSRRLSMAFMIPSVNIHRIYRAYAELCRAIGREVV